MINALPLHYALPISPVSIAYQHVREEPLAPSAYNPAITPAMDAVILTGLAKDRDRRYPSAVAFSRDISAVVTGREPDRKSTRLNSSHVATSYAVFCLQPKVSLAGAHTEQAE